MGGTQWTPYSQRGFTRMAALSSADVALEGGGARGRASILRERAGLRSNNDGERVRLFRRAVEAQLREGGDAGARLLFGAEGLHPYFWGVGKQQLQEAVDHVHALQEEDLIVGQSRVIALGEGGPPLFGVCRLYFEMGQKKKCQRSGLGKS